MGGVEGKGIGGGWMEWSEGGRSGVGGGRKEIELLILCITYRYRLRTNAHVS